MVSNRNCSVIGCGNSGARMQKWMKQVCPTHQCNQGSGACNCPPPFVLFTFPTKMRDSERRQKWIKAINRKSEDNKNWQPNDNSRVCSNHFVNGRPTEQNPDPSINLGYTPVTKHKKTRKEPTPRTPAPPKAKKQKVSNKEGESSMHDVLLDMNSATDTSSLNACSSEAPQDPQNKEVYELKAQLKETIETKDKIINELRQQDKRLKEMLQASKIQARQTKTKLHDFTWRRLNTDKKMKTFTGIPNKKIHCIGKLKRQYQN